MDQLLLLLWKLCSRLEKMDEASTTMEVRRPRNNQANTGNLKMVPRTMTRKEEVRAEKRTEISRKVRD